MNFHKIEMLIYILPFFLLFFFLRWHTERKFMKFIEDHWFFTASIYHKTSRILFVFFLVFIFFSLLDPRGETENITSKIPDQRTVILIDASSSMLTEDIRPNRFRKSLFLARHFIKQAVGHQIAILLFSDFQRKLIPFTDDINLLDAKIKGLEGLNINSGSSNISIAIKESIQYFKSSESQQGNIQGNILLFTDYEENTTGLDLSDIPPNINLAVVGIGTLKGGAIPIRAKDGAFIRYKEHKGKKVISKLNEDAIRSIGGQVKSFKYWITTSYSVPTNDIVQFFRKVFNKSLRKGLIKVSPTKYENYVIFSLALLSLSLLLGLFPSFRSNKIFLLLIVFSLSGGPCFSEGGGDKKDLMKNYKELDELGRMKIALEFFKKKDYRRARSIYEENFTKKLKENVTIYMNYASTLLALGERVKAISIYNEIKKKIN